MTTDFQKARDVFLAALDRPPEEWDAFVVNACGNDEQLRLDVVMLLKAHREGGSLFDPNTADAKETSAYELDSEQQGTTIAGRFKLLEPIGEGGMGKVWMAQQLEPVKRLVAIKLIKPGMDSTQVLARFDAERQALALMDHPNIAKVFDAGTTSDGRPYFVMELVKGVLITKYCDEHHLTPRQRLELFIPVCQAIQHAHQKGVIHRDIKPSNVLVAMYDDHPVPKVIDFGVAKATGQQLTEATLHTNFGAVVGTIEYMSPEQASFNQLDVDTRSDIYSLGVLLYELLAGSPPFTTKDLEKAGVMEMLRMIREQEPSKPSTKISSSDVLPSLSANRGTEPSRLTKLLRGELDWIVMKALEKDRSRRYETANGLARDIERYLADEPVLACPPSFTYRFKKFARRNKAAMLTAGVIAATLLLATAISAWQAVRATRAEGLAEKRLGAEKEARKEADANLEEAREAGHKFFTQVSESRLLEEPGLQPLRKDLLEAAFAYYERLATGRGNDAKAQADLAVSRLRLAQIYYQTGFPDRHIAALDKGVELVEELIREHPDATNEHLKLAGFWHGGRMAGNVVHEPCSDADRALHVFEKAAALWEKLVERYPTATGFQSDLSKFYDLLRGRQLIHGRPEEALRTMHKVREIREQIVRANPGVYEHVAELGHAYCSLARMLEDSDPEAAEAWYRQGVTIQKDAPDVVTYQDFQARYQVELGRFLAKRKRVGEAIPLLQESLGTYERLAAKHPHFAGFKNKVDGLKREIASLRGDTSPPAKDNRPAEQRAVALLKGLKAEDAPAVLFAAAMLYRQAGDASQRQQGPKAMSQAEQAYKSAIGLFEMHAAHSPTLGKSRAELALTLNSLADVLQTAGRPQEAEKARRQALAICEKLVVEFPREAPNWRRLALSRHALGHYDQAVAGYTKAIELERDFWPAWQRRGYAYAKLGRWEQAIADQTKALELDPKQWLTWFRRGQAHSALRQWDKAIQDCGKAIEHGATDADVWVSKGAAHANLGQWSQAIVDYANAIERNPRASGSVMQQLQIEGELPEAEAYYREAIAAFAKLVAAHPNVCEYLKLVTQVRQRLADLLRARGRHQEAVEVLRQTVTFLDNLPLHDELTAEFPNDVGYRHLLAVAHQRLGEQLQGDEAEKECRTALGIFAKLVAETHGEHAEFVQQMGHCHRRLGYLAWAAGNTKEAEQLFGKALNDFEKLSATHPDVAGYRHFLADTHRLIGKLLELRKQFPEAEKAHRRSIEIHEQRIARFPDEPIADPNHQGPRLREVAASYLDFGAFLVAAGREQDAETVWQKAAEGLAVQLKSPTADAYAWYEYALLCLQLGQKANYQKACAQMLERFDQSASADSAYWIVWTTVLAPNAVADWTKPLRFAEKAHAADGMNSDKINHLGAVLYRAGRLKEAAQRLTEAEAAFKQTPSARSSIVYNWLFQAMAQHKLGNATEAASWLKKAVQKIDESKTTQASAAMFWNRRLTQQLLRREAEELLKKESGVRNQESEKKPE